MLKKMREGRWTEEEEWAKKKEEGIEPIDDVACVNGGPQISGHKLIYGVKIRETRNFYTVRQAMNAYQIKLKDRAFLKRTHDWH